MKKKVYELTITRELIDTDTGTVIDTFSAPEDYYTIRDAEEAAQRYKIGGTEPGYIDGTKMIICGLHLSREPQIMDMDSDG